MESQGETLVGVVGRLQQQHQQRAKALELQANPALAEQLDVASSPTLSHDRRVRLFGWDLTWVGTHPRVGMGAFLDWHLLRSFGSGSRARGRRWTLPRLWPQSG